MLLFCNSCYICYKDNFSIPLNSIITKTFFVFLNFDLVRVVLAATVSSMLLSSLFIDVACCVCVTVTSSVKGIKIFRKDSQGIHCGAEGHTDI